MNDTVQFDTKLIHETGVVTPEDLAKFREAVGAFWAAQGKK